MKQNEIIEKITNRIIAKLNEGVNPWKKPWSGFASDLDPKCFAINYVSGEAYTGINQVVLDPGYYVSYKQAVELGGKPARDKGEMVVYSNSATKEVTDEELLTKLNDLYKEALENGEIHEGERYKVVLAPLGVFTRELNTKWTTTFWVLKEYYVWNINDCPGIREVKHNKVRKVAEFNKDAEEVIKDYCTRANLALYREFGNRAYYCQTTHEVHLPTREQFAETAEHYSTAFHELGHSTGHSSLLNRKTLVNYDGFGGQNYSKEELVAEITAAYSVATLGIDTDSSLNNSAAYLQSWASHILGDKNLQRNIISATTEATKAFRLIFNA